jgi:hypothetical protein
MGVPAWFELVELIDNFVIDMKDSWHDFCLFHGVSEINILSFSHRG